MMCSNLDTSQLLSLVETHFGKAGYVYSTRESSREWSTLERVGSKGRTLTLVVSPYCPNPSDGKGDWGEFPNTWIDFWEREEQHIGQG